MSKKYLIALCTLLTLCFFLPATFFSCKNEPIFYGIEQEINLDDPIVRGNVYSLTEVGDKLYVANGKIFIKNSNLSRNWKEAKKPEGLVIRIASDSTHLYALTIENALFVSPQGENLNWSLLENSIMELFDNNALDASNKKAFITKEDGAYILLEGAVSDLITTGGASKDSVTAEYVNGNTYFSSSVLFTSDREGLLYTYGSEGIAYSSDNIEWTGMSITLEYSMSLEYVKNADLTSLFVGTKTGLVQILITEGINATKSSSLPGANADSCFGKSHVPAIFAYPYGEGVVYTASMKPDNSKNTKFWAYYPSKNYWNLE